MLAKSPLAADVTGQPSPPRHSTRLRGRPKGARAQLTRQVRHVHLGHFAFMRAIIQGLPIRESYERYLAKEDVPFRADRVVSGTLRWLREEFAAAARKSAKHGRARLIELDLSEIPPSNDTLPNIDDWAAETGWAGFSENEVLTAYQEAHAGQANTRAERRTRLIEKQLDAVRWLESLIAQKPGAGDACAAWFSSSMSMHLTDVGIMTLAQLIERINGVGRQWSRTIRGLGPTKARRLEGWLREHEASIGQSLGAHISVPRMQLYREELDQVMPAATAIRPLEKFVVPVALNGEQGAYRLPQRQCLMSARNDYEAILAWVKSKHPLSPEAQANNRARKRGRTGLDPNAPLAWLDVLSHTQRACRKEAERFLLWAILERQKPLSSMTIEDCTAYRDFLADPQPSDDWCGPRGRERWSPLWRPFVGPLSVPAQHLAITHLKNLYHFLVSQNYLMGNPWVGVAMPRKAKQGIDTGRSFTQKQWLFVNTQLNELEATPEKKQRLAVVLGLLYATGLRLSEAVNARIGDLTWLEYPGAKGQELPTTGWELVVVGKGGKQREVVVPNSIVELLKGYLSMRGLPADFNAAALADQYWFAPLTTHKRMPSVTGEHRDDELDLTESDTSQAKPQPIATNTLYVMLKSFFTECADVQNVTDAKGAQRLAQASTHWLRHTHASHTIAAGVPIEVAQASLGHASLATTTNYVTTEKERRMRTMQAALDG